LQLVTKYAENKQSIVKIDKYLLKSHKTKDIPKNIINKSERYCGYHRLEDVSNGITDESNTINIPINVNMINFSFDNNTTGREINPAPFTYDYGSVV